MEKNRIGSTGHLFCFGLGFSARKVGLELIQRGWRVTGTSRSQARCSALEAEGFTPLIFDARQTPPEIDFSGITHLLCSVPPDPRGDSCLRIYQQSLQKAAQIVPFHWIGYFSTTGVYGDHQGGWVDENTPPAPVNDRSFWRLKAETDFSLLAQELATPLAIFRISGIYGPGRNRLEDLRHGLQRQVVKPGQVFNRIHVDDLVQMVLASLTSPPQRGVHTYNACDEEPAPPEDVTDFAAGLLGIPPVLRCPFEEAHLSPMSHSFFSENKRCSSLRTRQELGVHLFYPTYREGLSALLKD